MDIAPKTKRQGLINLERRYALYLSNNNYKPMVYDEYIKMWGCWDDINEHNKNKEERVK